MNSLKSHMDNKIIELNTKLELLLNNIGNAKDENGEVNLQKKIRFKWIK
jgi:hypothetical protein